MMCWISRRLGGDQLDYADESAWIRAQFEESLRLQGLSSRMAPVYEKELETLPAKPV
jgi:hypothetical protein